MCGQAVVCDALLRLRPRKELTCMLGAHRGTSPKRAHRRGLGPGRIGQGGKGDQDRRLDLPSDRPARRSKAQCGPASPGSRWSPGAFIAAEPERIGATADRARLFVLGVREQAARR